MPAKEPRAHLRELDGQLSTLTQRKRQVLDLVVLGKLNKEIADELSIQERTVKAHRSNITTKLRVRSVAELTRLVVAVEESAANSAVLTH